MESKNLIDSYISNLSDIRNERVKMMVDYIRKKYPECEEFFKYKMPVYEFNNTYIAFASQKGYLSFYCEERKVIKYISKHNTHLSFGKGCVRFKDSDDFDEEIIKKSIDMAFTGENICKDCKQKTCDGCQL